ncbi:TetR/AcrR family transcriptional regulator [Streptosporangium sp. NBC_01756]|uniref:TetR/AcrR family transcriptional regulator n=1 Tax=Streptosporangium sp. NBC_01756 TaxID=2975950 RepID=UPI002DDC6FC3|nr:TetR/AcrR family transcriptional regulator [Streptosporangium sp. NBC_01756]WSC89601.1 TetR/AcrR family transcriptional regulator [Streptosporangium sp. NBC_01756]
MTDTDQPSRRGRGRPRDPETDAAILRAALEVFVERGVDGAGIEQIAKRASVGKLTIYRRWDSKEKLLAQAIESARGDIPEPSAEDVTDLPVAELIEHILPAAAATLAAPGFRALIARVLGSAVSHPTLMATYWEHYILPRRRVTRLLLERAIRQGVLAADTDIDALMDMMVGAVIYRLVQPDPLTATQMASYLRGVYRQSGLLPIEQPNDQ